MTASAATWFYRQPETNPYLLAERMRTCFWDARLGSLWLDTISTAGPLVMQGTYIGSAIKLEWEPRQWLRLSSQPAQTSLTDCVQALLQRRPDLRYETPQGDSVWEWRIADVEKRWQEIQGKTSYSNLQRLDHNK